MTTFFYRCPTTGYNVQGFVVDSAAVPDDTVYEAVTCALCRRVHLVNPKTSRVIALNLSSADRTRVRSCGTRQSDTMTALMSPQDEAAPFA